MEQSGLLADTISQLEAFLKAAEDQVHQQQTTINKVRFIVAALRDESDVSSMLVELEKMKIPSHSSQGAIEMASASNGYQDVEAAHLKDHYLRTTKEWIALAVIKSDTPLLPGQVYRMAREAGVKMHRNYPYVALKQLVKDHRIKQVGRGYARLDYAEKPNGPVESAPGRSERVRHDVHNPTNQWENDPPTVHR